MRFLFVQAGLLVAFIPGARAQQPLPPPDEMVRRTVANELEAANDPGHYLYRLRRETPRGSETFAVIETRDWLIKRRILLNGAPLSEDQREEEDLRLQRLVSDPRALRKLRQDQRRHERRVRELLRALPDAFHYEYDGAEQAESGRSCVRLKFRPNEAFEPASRELQILRGMEGMMLVDREVHRLVRIQGRLFRRVSFAWGILGHLDEGGRFLLEQRDVGVGRWQITVLAIHFTGKVLLFKKINIDSTLRTSDFRRVEDALTLLQGLDLLRQEDERAKRSPTGGAPP